MQFVIPDSMSLREANDCHNPAGAGGGQFCSKTRRSRPGRERGGDGYTLVFKSERDKLSLRGENRYVMSLLSGEEARKMRRAKVFLVFDGSRTAHIGAPIKWTAPNGVLVVYMRGQRRSRSAEEKGLPNAGVYHDFRPDSDEYVAPATRNIGAGRRALRAWAAEHMGSTITARMTARQMVRPGD